MRFSNFSPEQAETLAPIEPQQLTMADFKNLDDFENEINQLILDEEIKADSKSAKPKPESQNFGYQHLKSAGIQQICKKGKARFTMGYNKYKN